MSHTGSFLTFFETFNEDLGVSNRNTAYFDFFQNLEIVNTENQYVIPKA